MKTEIYPQVIKPMLAFPYEEERFTPGCFIQPKLDGIRALYQNGQFVSRALKIWDSKILKHLTDELSSIPTGVVLDGELYCHGLPLQEINKRVAVKRTQTHPDIKSIQYWIFDCVHVIPFLDRFRPLWHTWKVPTEGSIKIVPTHYVNTVGQANSFYNHYRSLGYEGIMYRHPDDPYSLPWHCSRKDNRSWSLMKRKGGFDLSDCKILQIEAGTGKYENSTGYLVISHPEVPKNFRVGSGLSDMERALLFAHRNDLDGMTVDIKFDEYSADHIPLRLRVAALHLNEELSNSLV